MLEYFSKVLEYILNKRKVVTLSQKQTGKVKWFNNKKGFGFIIPDEGGKDLFVHINNILMDGYKTLSDDQAVEFESEEGEKGLQAINVTPK